MGSGARKRYATSESDSSHPHCSYQCCRKLRRRQPALTGGSESGSQCPPQPQPCMGLLHAPKGSPEICPRTSIPGYGVTCKCEPTTPKQPATFLESSQGSAIRQLFERYSIRSDLAPAFRTPSASAQADTAASDPAAEVRGCRLSENRGGR